ncbi:MAG: prepilin-type N-terminal cleavage/methylation domain-containing protein [bacterium]
MHHKSPAFTLIELIIGITILSLLAVALLAALDPIEQISKARDTAKRNLAVELHGAYVRYNANKDTYPTNLAAAVGVGTYQYLTSAQLKTDITSLISAGELKPNFLQAAGSNLDSLRVGTVVDTVNGTYLSICYKPQSKLELQKQGLFTVTGLVSSNMTGTWPAPPTVPASDGNGAPTGCAAALTTLRTECVYCAQ